MTKLFRAAGAGLFATFISIQAASAGGTPDWTNSLGNSINWLSISGDGNVIFTGNFLFKESGNFTVYCLDKTGAIKWKDPFLTNGWTGINWTGLSQDGSYGAAGGWYDTNAHTGFLRVYQTSSGALVCDDRPPGRVEGIAVSSNGTWIASCAKDLRLYQMRTIKFPIFHKLPIFKPISSGWQFWPIWRWFTYCTPTSTNYPSGEQYHSVAMSQDGHWIVAGGSGPNDTGGKVRLFENQQGTLTLVQTWYTNLASIYYIQSVDMTPDGNWFAASHNDGGMLMFNRTNFAATGQPAWSFAVNTSGKSVWSVRVSANGSEVAAASNGLNNGGHGVCMVKNVAGTGGSYSPQLLWNAHTTNTPNPGLGMDANAKYVVAADGYPAGQPAHFYLLNATNGAQIWSYPTPDMNWPIAISSDGKSITGGGDNGVAYHWKN